MRPTRALISTEAFLHNLRFVRERIGPKPIIMAVVKANAYGHGLEIIAKSAIESGLIGYFGVATEEEGVLLRQLTSLPIQVLTTALDNEIDTFIQHHLDFTLCEAHQLEAISSAAARLGKKARIHLKIDTGMRRIGVEPSEALDFAKKIDADLNLEFVGIATHFATSDEPDSPFFHKQLAVFSEVVARIKAAGITPKLVHAANSGAILQEPLASCFDMVRPGIVLYGYAPSRELQAIYGNEIRPVLDLVSFVGYKKQVRRGEGVSYNLRWHADHDTQIATIPAGYGDGYSRILTGRSNTIINGALYPVRGTICMDQIMVEAGEGNVNIGDEVTLISASDPLLNAWEIASVMGTIPYEVLTNITARVPRVVRQ